MYSSLQRSTQYQVIVINLQVCRYMCEGNHFGLSRINHIRHILSHNPLHSTGPLSDLRYSIVGRREHTGSETVYPLHSPNDRQFACRRGSARTASGLWKMEGIPNGDTHGYTVHYKPTHNAVDLYVPRSPFNKLGSSGYNQFGNGWVFSSHAL